MDELALPELTPDRCAACLHSWLEGYEAKLDEIAQLKIALAQADRRAAAAEARLEQARLLGFA